VGNTGYVARPHDEPAWIGRQHNQTILFSVAGASTAGIAAIILFALLVPIRSTMLEQDRSRFAIESQLIYHDVAGYLEQATQIASQIPSRTRIREELVAYLRGDRSIADTRAFTAPKLADAADAADEIVAVTRVTPDRRVVAAVGPSIALPETLSFNTQAPTIAACTTCAGDGTGFVVIVPIRHPGFGLAGFDLVGMSIRSLQERLVDAAHLFPNTRVELLEDGEPFATAGVAPDEDQGGAVAYTYAVSSHWRLVVSRPRDELFHGTRRFITIMGLAVLAVAGALFLVILAAMRIVNDRTRAAADRLSSEVEERTAELRRALEGRQLLLREVHHRIKNDLAMVSSLLALRREESGDDAVRSALSEADSRVRVMSHLYDELYRAEDFSTVRIKPILDGFLQQYADLDITAAIEDVAVDRKLAAPVGIIINELVVNAVKYGHEPGRAPQISVRLSRHSHTTLAITVTDSGPGISTTAGATTSGFGLSMVQAFAEQFHGSVSIPTTGEGGVVHVTLSTVDPSGGAPE